MVMDIRLVACDCGAQNCTPSFTLAEAFQENNTKHTTKSTHKGGMYGDESQTDRPVCLAETTQRTNHAAPIHVSKVAVTCIHTALHRGTRGVHHVRGTAPHPRATFTSAACAFRGMILLLSTREARWSCTRPSPAAPSVAQEGMAALEAVRFSASWTAASATALAGMRLSWMNSSPGSAPLSSAEARAAQPASVTWVRSR